MAEPGKSSKEKSIEWLVMVVSAPLGHRMGRDVRRGRVCSRRIVRRGYRNATSDHIVDVDNMQLWEF